MEAPSICEVVKGIKEWLGDEEKECGSVTGGEAKVFLELATMM